MFLSRASVVLSATILGFAHAETCPSVDDGTCDFEPTNPYSCGEDYSCAYSNRCLAEAAGFNIEEDCCQAPQPSACGFIFEPLICGTKECPYDNECIASLAGYDPSQCTAAPPTCPEGDKDCSGEPSNPYTCGSNDCVYSTVCDAESAGFDIGDDCCQDTSSNTVCTANIAPVSCGPPGGKQCGYSTQCLADAAGYNSEQCCNAVPEGIACTANFEPVQCGTIPCVYSNQCEADAAGATECCRQVPDDIVCTMEYSPKQCGAEKCGYSNQCLAEAAGYTSDQCCNAVPDGVACTANYEPVTCGASACVYSNSCEAEAAGFDPDSCVPIPQAQAQPESMATTGEGDVSGTPATLTDGTDSGSNGLAVTIGLLASTAGALGMII